MRMLQFQRAHLEALLVAHAAIDDYYLDACDPARLSPACNILLDLTAEYSAAARADLVNVARTFGDEYAVRLAKRTVQLTVVDLLSVSREVLVALCNRLPEISRSSGSAAVKRAA